MRAQYISLSIVALASGIAWGQSVWFDVVPAASATVEENSGPVEEVLPGAVVSFEIVAEVVNYPDAPAHAGLASFNVNVETNLGVAQPLAVTFDAGVVPLFVDGSSAGTSLDDDIVNISGQQPTKGGLIATGIALNQPAVIATGQLTTPTVEGAFKVDVRGSATVFGIGVGPILTREAGVMSFGSGFTIQTQIPQPVTPDEPAVPSASSTPEEVAAADGTDTGDEQVAATNPGSPTAVCGLGAELAMAMGLARLGIKRRYLPVT